MSKVMDGPIRIFVLDDDALFRQSVALLLDSPPERKVVGQSSKVYEALRAIRDSEVDLILVDVGLPESRAHNLLNELPSECRCKVLLITVRTDLGKITRL